MKTYNVQLKLEPDGGGGFQVRIIGPGDREWFMFHIAKGDLFHNMRALVLHSPFKKRVEKLLNKEK